MPKIIESLDSLLSEIEEVEKVGEELSEEEIWNGDSDDFWELDDFDDEDEAPAWGEMSYNRYNHTDRWSQ